MTDPTDAEIEAMAEKLWDASRGTVAGHSWINIGWSDVRGAKVRDTEALVAAFRAMARVALSARHD